MSLDLIAKDRLASIPSIEQMIDRTDELYARFPGHERAQINPPVAAPSSRI
jgi:hypothetical protein